MNFLLNTWFNKINEFEKKISFFSHDISYGRVLSVNNLIIEATGVYLPIGNFCWVERIYKDVLSGIICKIIGFKEKIVFLVPMHNLDGIFPGAKVFSQYSVTSNVIKYSRFPFGYKLLGRVLDSFGHPLDNLGNIQSKKKSFNFFKSSINPLQRFPITDILDTGVRAINSLLTVGRGQRMGIFSQPGIGKSMLLGMISRYTDADIIVVSLVGERGREVKEFIDNVLGAHSLKKSVVIVSPADVSPILKIQSVQYATSIAEDFCKKNNHVLLIVDSLTRYAMAYREMSNAMHEIPVLKGYPASIFSNIPYLIERTGNINDNGLGSITAFYTVLTEGDEYNDPILDIAKSVLDGHIILSNVLSEAGHYPAIDIEKSISRSMHSIVDRNHYKNSIYLKKLISCYYRHHDLINLGVYSAGTNKLLDNSIKIWPILEKFLQQKFLECCTYTQSISELIKLLQNI
ncbi:Flagellum-specific ATP synthase [Buchnera aphidicola (Cinara kochiana kochiana)]|uniref:Flagellum-specific ATP synthase n=1 Tax=Buchnera aphidicola (Cinara kochiana kochiana) TaxID=2518976 RepID=A0A451D562_9GAMM|nr:FliI/YscN family ATPase [Buchnera aphidicola]VFP80968.1 Flagellum-specific ATP synthase [Buchnera aphidicola (Cinara kochiana kochiana)]